MTPNSTQNQVRQVLVNELGLTRESIRQEMKAYVEQAVERHLGTDQFQQLLAERIFTRINTLLSSYRGEEKLEKIIITEVRSEIERQAKDFVKSRLTLGIVANEVTAE